MTSKPWLLGDGSKTTDTDLRTRTYRYDHINEALILAGIVDQASFSDFATYLGYSGGGPTPTYQDMQVAWTPSNLNLGENIGLVATNDIPGLTGNLIFTGTTMLYWVDLQFMTGLQSVAFPNLLTIDPLNTNSGYLALISCSALNSFSAPVLTTAFQFTIRDSSPISSIPLPSLVTCGNLRISGNTALTTLSLPVFLPTNGATYELGSNALNVASVDGFLARGVANAAFVSGTINIDGGTNAAPSSIAPGSDYATLVARGVSVNVNP